MLRAVRDVLVCGTCQTVVIALTLESPVDIVRIALLMDVLTRAVRTQTLILCDNCIIRQQYRIGEEQSGG